jgi:DNA invertase Pin-like site-specific DNA recombinase
VQGVNVYTCLKGEEIPRFFFHGMARLAQTERELTIERTRTGLETARKPGRNGGRKHRMRDSKIESARKLLSNGMPPRDVTLTELG